MKINKANLDKLILDVLKEQSFVSANPLVDSPNPEKSFTTQSKSTLGIKPQASTEKIDINKVQIDKSILNSLRASKEKLRANMDRIPAKELISQVSTLIDQLSFLDNLKL